MKKFDDIFKIGKLKISDEYELTCKLEKFIKEIDLEVGKSQKKSWLQCISY
ncbi:hypothetical protein [Clostridium sp. ATCC 25772]|uniref:hypothetical protein n=1 Tax=Clostridium sp. ATCC 25772 TaxID=1676991 RepID=UPI000A5A23BF|nr:hypothetical protein [Clostridium sp. ATCC 25772]